MGSLQYSPPPAAVLNACNTNFTTTIAQTAYAPGQVSISYAQGSLPQQFTIVPSELISGFIRPSGLMAFDVGGQWQCENAINLTLNHGSTSSYPVWLLLPVLTNAQPHVSTKELHSVQFNFSALGLSELGLNTIKPGGPDGANCSSSTGKYVMFKLFQSAPYTNPDPNSVQGTGIDHCH